MTDHLKILVMMDHDRNLGLGGTWAPSPELEPGPRQNLCNVISFGIWALAWKTHWFVTDEPDLSRLQETVQLRWDVLYGPAWTIDINNNRVGGDQILIMDYNVDKAGNDQREQSMVSTTTLEMSNVDNGRYRKQVGKWPIWKMDRIDHNAGDVQFGQLTITTNNEYRTGWAVDDIGRHWVTIEFDNSRYRKTPDDDEFGWLTMTIKTR